MHRSWFRTKLAEKKTEVATKVKSNVTARAKALIPQKLTESAPRDNCMVCGKKLKPHSVANGDGRVCSPACAHAWVKGL
ncbi:hypothetical protein [Crossiella sp. NPDC003009]